MTAHLLVLLFVTFVVWLFVVELPHALASPGRARCPGARAAIVFYRDATHRWQTQRDARLTPAGNAERSPGCRYVRWAAHRWQHRARAERHAYRAWLLAMLGPNSTSGKWGCIHSREAAWNDEGLPQMGGLQMDPDFQATYGSEFIRSWGDAGHWPIWAQLVAAERAYHGYAGYGARGFGPWPNTARACGLL